MGGESNPSPHLSTQQVAVVGVRLSNPGSAIRIRCKILKIKESGPE